MNFIEMLCDDLLLSIECPRVLGNIKIEVFYGRKREKDIYPLIFRIEWRGDNFYHMCGKTIDWSRNDITDYVTGLKTSHTYYLTKEYVNECINDFLHELEVFSA